MLDAIEWEVIDYIPDADMKGWFLNDEKFNHGK